MQAAGISFIQMLIFIILFFQARRLEALGAVGGIVLDNTLGTSAKSSPMFAMSGDGTDDVNIPLVFLFSGDAEVLLKALDDHPGLEVVLSDFDEKGKESLLILVFRKIWLKLVY